MPNTQTATIENPNTETTELEANGTAQGSNYDTHDEASHNEPAEAELNIEAEETEVEENEVAEEHDEEFSPALLFIEDFVLTSLLSAGRPLRSSELEARAEGWTLPRQALKDALRKSKSVVLDDLAWDCKWRVARKGMSREERHRQPLEAILRELLLTVGKPLPAAVLAREVSTIRNVADPQIKNAVTHLLQTSRFAFEIAPDVFLHQDFVFKTGAPNEELLIKENGLASDIDFQGLMKFAEITSTTPMEIARELMEFTGGPLNQKVIGFFVYRAINTSFSAEQLAAMLNDRTHFQPLMGGFVTLKDQLESLKEQTQEYLEEMTNPSEPVDIGAIVEQHKAAIAAAPINPLEPSETDLNELKRLAKNDTAPLAVAQAVLQLFDFEADDARLIPAIEGMTTALENNADWLSIGNGAFILRENLPPGVNEIPEALKPVVNESINPATGEAFDFELEDEGLEPSCIKWVHSSYWDDIFETGEVRDAQNNSHTAKLTVLNHHIRARTIRLRHSDEAIFSFEGPIASMTIIDKAENEAFEVWVSRETGLIYGLGLWCEENLPPSGGTVQFNRDGDQVYIAYAGPDTAAFLTERRVDELEEFLETANRISLFELLGELLNNSKSGMELPALHASINVLRRTTKRQLTSILSGYSCFEQRVRGQKTFWHLNGELKDAAKSFNPQKRASLRSK